MTDSTALPPFHTSVVDTETDDLNATKLYCVVVRDVLNPKLKQTFVNVQEVLDAGLDMKSDWSPLEEFPDWAAKNIVNWVAHNYINFDGRILKQFLNIEVDITNVIDTLVMSKLFLPYREGGHSLEAWGIRLKRYKLQFDDFSKFSYDMVTYCEEDTAVNVLTYHALLQEQKMWGFSEFSVRLEHRIKDIICRQERHGFFLDQPKALQLFQTTKDRMSVVEAEMAEVFCPQPIIKKVVVPKFTKDGKLSSVGLKSIKDYAERVGIDLTKHLETKQDRIVVMELEDFNIGSPPQVKERLIEIGWKPLNLTPKGQPKIDEESLAPFVNQFPQVKLLSEFLMLRHRNALAEQWLDLVDDKGYVHGRVDTMGAITGRMTHSEPNTANIPAASDGVPYGKDCRACWTVKDKSRYTLVGCDASSLELRMLCHYMDDEDYTREVLSGDIHTKNQKAAGLSTRAEAKTFIYACVPMDTTVLTKRGWVDYYSLNIGELVLTYNSKTGVKEWKPVLEKVFYQDAEVIEMKHSNGFIVKSTPNHRWFVDSRKQVGYRGARSYIKNVKTTEELNSEDNIITNAPLFEDQVPNLFSNIIKEKYEYDWVSSVINMSRQERMAFLQGFLLADGHLKPSKSGWQWSQNVNNLSEALLVASYLEHDGFLHVSNRTNVNGKQMISVNLSKRPRVTAQRIKKTKLANQPVWCIRTENESFVMRQGNVITITGNTIYGAGDGKLGSIVGGGVEAGRKLRKKFFTSIPKLARLFEDIGEQAKYHGYVVGLDGRRIWTRSEHAALNTLLQGGGAIVCKLWAVFIDMMATEAGLDFQQVAQVHDEYQYQVRIEHVDQFGQITKDAMKKVEKVLKLKCPLDSEWKSGSSWDKTH